MKIAYLIFLILHGFFHLPGFLKAFGLNDFKELTLPIPRPLGILWLSAALFFLIYGLLFILNNKYAWMIGFAAVIISQVLIVLFWKDARFGTIANLVIFLVLMPSYGLYNFQNMVNRETDSLLGKGNWNNNSVFSSHDMEKLPEVVRKWMIRSGMVGKPVISVGKIWQKAELKMKPGQEQWFSATAVQYTSIDEPSFIWSVDVKMNTILFFTGKDKFEDGKGEMLIKLNSLINVVNEKGEKLDEGSIQRYLGEMVWFPSLAVSPYIDWQQVNDSTAIATMDYKGTKASGTFYFNEDGDFIRYSALRYQGNDPDAKRYEWVLTVQEHRSFEGIRVPSKMTATWKLENGDWTWLKLEVTGLVYNEKVLQWRKQQAHEQLGSAYRKAV